MSLGAVMLDDEIAEIVENLRVLGTDCADVEVKRAQGGLPKSVRETISAFANTRGGIILLGLDEGQGFTGTGLTNPGKLTSDLAAVCSDEMDPPCRPLIKVHEFEGRSVLVAEIPELAPSQKPCYVRGAGIGKGSYVRVGDGDRRLSPYEVHIMLSSRGQPREDEEPIRGVGVDALDPVGVDSLIARLRTSRPFAFKDLDPHAVLRRAKVLVPDESGGEAVSLGGLLALGRYPQENFPQLMVTFVHYPTVRGAQENVRFLDNVVLEGAIPVMVQDVLVAIRRNMSRRAIISGAGRQDVWDYPETALREAVVNALVHRDLSSGSRGTQVQIEMYPDRLTIRNPGGLFGPVTIDSLGEAGISSARNASLLKTLEDVPLPGEVRTVCENRGTGIRNMIDSLRSAGMSPPEFSDKISSFAVTFPNHTLLSEETIEWINSLGERGLTDSQCIALAHMRADGLIDNRGYRAVTGVDSRVATSELQDLVARELVAQSGTRRWTTYRLATRGASGKVGQTDRGDRRSEILEALGTETLSRAELVQRTGLSDKSVSRWLRIMRDEGTVEAAGAYVKSKFIRYRRTGQQHLFPPGENDRPAD